MLTGVVHVHYVCESICLSFVCPFFSYLADKNKQANKNSTLGEPIVVVIETCFTLSTCVYLFVLCLIVYLSVFVFWLIKYKQANMNSTLAKPIGVEMELPGVVRPRA